MDDKNIQLRQNSPAQAGDNNSRIQPDAPTINDSKANVASNNLDQGTAGRELSPEYGDAADPASEQMASGGRGDS